MPESEKITINMSAVDLGKVDLLVQEGLYSNRTDFIRTAIRNLLDKHNLEIQQSVTRHSYGVGAFYHSLKDFERYKTKGEKIKTPIDILDLNSATIYAEQDIKDKWEHYKQRYLKG